MKRLPALLCSLFLASACVLAQPKLIRVPQDQPTVQAGIDAAINGDTVLVEEGTYLENIRLNKKIVLGSRYILDGDTSHISKTILDGGLPSNPESASVIVISGSSDSTTVVAGFTIRNGRGTRWFDGSTSKYWRGGFGIYLAAGAANIHHNCISENSATSTDGVWGGGIGVLPVDGPLKFWIIENNQIRNNDITSTATSVVSAEGGGVWITGNGRFNSNVVAKNSAVGIVYGAGGGIHFFGNTGYGTSTVEMSNNVIRANVASHWGGGIVSGVDASLLASPILTLKNNVIAGNSSGREGGAMYFNGGEFTLINNSIIDNVSSQAWHVESSRGTLTIRLLNNILWNPDCTRELVEASGGYAKSISMSYSIVRGGYSGTGNLDVDPDLEPHSGYYFLREGSPARNAGVQSATVGGVLLTAPSSCLPLEPWWSPPLPIPPPIGPHANVRDSNPDIGAHEYDPPVGLEETEGAMPTELSLSQNYPNPFNPTTTIEYALPQQSHVSLRVYNLLGEEVAVLADEMQSAGYKSVKFNASAFPTGMYIYRLTAGEYTATRKLVLVK